VNITDAADHETNAANPSSEAQLRNARAICGARSSRREDLGR